MGLGGSNTVETATVQLLEGDCLPQQPLGLDRAPEHCGVQGGVMALRGASVLVHSITYRQVQ